MPFRAILVPVFLMLFAAPLASQYIADDTSICRRVYADVLAEANRMRPSLGTAARIPWPPRLVFELPGKVLPEACAWDSSLQRWCPSPPCRPLPYVAVNLATLRDVIKRDRHRAAFIFGHELAHHLLNHIRRTRELARDLPGDAAFSLLLYSREMELQADSLGLHLALAAGFRRSGAVEAMERFREKHGDYSSFEGTGLDHPSWTQRLAYLDSMRRSYWLSMASFTNGAHFLQLEHYIPAETCFREVLFSYPKCGEASANLGYALLMQYCDNLKESDLRSFGIPRIVTGTFCKRPESLRPPATKGLDDERLWLEAVDALYTALDEMPESYQVYANIGLAYIVAPRGLNVDAVQKAKITRTRQRVTTSSAFDSALSILDKQRSIDGRDLAAVLLNATAAGIQDGDAMRSRRLLARYESGRRRMAFTETSELESARRFASAETSLRFGGNRGKARAEMLACLKSTSRSSLWWDIARAKYDSLCIGKERSLLKNASIPGASSREVEYRVASSIAVGDSALWITMPVSRALDILGPCERSSLIQGRDMFRYLWPNRRLEVIATNNEVLAFRITGPDGPSLLLQERGVATRDRALTIAVGKPEDTFRQRISKSGASAASPIDGSKGMWYSATLGFGYKSEKGLVTEIVIVQAARAL